MPLILEKQD